MDTFDGSAYDTVVRVMDSCDSEIACDDDGSEWVTYPSDFTSAVEIEATEGSTLGIVIDAYSSSTTAGAYTLTITEGNCPGPGATCALDDGSDGIYDCDGVCIADSRGDGTCDPALECVELEWDGDDCEAPVAGADCDYEGWSGVEPGVIDCDLTCRPASYFGDAYCDSYFDCEDLSFDDGDCVDTLEACTLEDGSEGIYDCDKVCSADTRGDGTCDPGFDCAEADYDSDDCEAPGPGDECTYFSGWFGDETGVVDCDGTCQSASYLGDGTYCDSYFDCEELAFDDGDCLESGDACTLEDESEGIYDCDLTCAADTTADDECDEGEKLRGLRLRRRQCATHPR